VGANPYQKENGMRPNPTMMRNALFHILDIQTLRNLSETEVRQINLITKERASRYLAGSNEEWLFPEHHVSKSDWHDFGAGYLLMPDPRTMHYSGETIMSFADGRSIAIDSFGRRPGDQGYSGGRSGIGPDWNSFHRFQGEFSRLFGQERRGRSFRGIQLDLARLSDDYFHSLLNGEERFKRLLSGGEPRVSIGFLSSLGGEPSWSTVQNSRRRRAEMARKARASVAIIEML
jgi:hypothetical protein